MPYIVDIPVPFDQLLERVASGQGGIAAAGLTVTSDRQETVAFTDPYLKGVTEVVVGRPGLGELAGLESLAGRQLVVRRGSSYAQHLENLDRRLQGLGYPGITIREADSRLATEDILELVNSGAIDLTVAGAPGVREPQNKPRRSDLLGNPQGQPEACGTP